MFFKKKPQKLEIKSFIYDEINKRIKANQYTFEWVCGAVEMAEKLGVFDIEDSTQLTKAASNIDVEISKNIKREKEKQKAAIKEHKEKQKKEKAAN